MCVWVCQWCVCVCVGCVYNGVLGGVCVWDVNGVVISKLCVITHMCVCVCVEVYVCVCICGQWYVCVCGQWCVCVCVFVSGVLYFCLCGQWCVVFLCVWSVVCMCMWSVMCMCGQWCVCVLSGVYVWSVVCMCGQWCVCVVRLNCQECEVNVAEISCVYACGGRLLVTFTGVMTPFLSFLNEIKKMHFNGDIEYACSCSHLTELRLTFF